ncbi:chemotaxis protein CheW [Metabacillus fastidiosus]|uniref:chemotaxis protein CheW n=1 Tax=Metabacillus fastidiosus TaxID=1458 RepID=UPI003D273A68
MMASKFIIFNTNSDEYGLPIEKVTSIEKMEGLNTIPEMPGYMKGVVKVRGELIPVLDTKQIFYRKDSVTGADLKLIVIQTDQLHVALIVEEAKEIIEIQEEDLKSINMGVLKPSSYFTAVASLENRLITIVDPNELINNLDEIEVIKEGMSSYL